MPGKRVARTSKSRASRFARIDNAALQDERLSFRARGILAYVLSMPTDWAHAAERLANGGPDGEAAVTSALQELEACGYSWLRKVRAATGRVDNQRYFSETPNVEKTGSLTSPRKSGVGDQPPENQPLVDRPAGEGGVYETTVGETTIKKTTIHAQSAGKIKSGSLSLPEAEALADGDTPAKAAAWSQWVGYLGEKRMLGRLTVAAQREAFEQFGDNAPAAVANTITAGLRRLCLPNTSPRPSALVKALPNHLNIF